MHGEHKYDPYIYTTMNIFSHKNGGEEDMNNMDETGECFDT